MLGVAGFQPNYAQLNLQKNPKQVNFQANIQDDEIISTKIAKELRNNPGKEKRKALLNYIETLGILRKRPEDTIVIQLESETEPPYIGELNIKTVIKNKGREKVVEMPFDTFCDNLKNKPPVAVAKNLVGEE